MAYLQVVKSIDRARLTPDLREWAVEELLYAECNPEVARYLLDAKEAVKGLAEKPPNPNNSTVAYLMGITDQKPSAGIKRTPTSPPDFDFDTHARDELKQYLVAKYGKDHVVLLGTYQTLKTKGAIKDVCKYLRPEMSFEELNNITKKFILNRNDFDKEIDFFEGSLENDPGLEKWFAENADVKDAVAQLLGTARSSGIHAGGIVLSSADVKSFCALDYDASEGLFVTQPEMASVEAIGLIKNDFLGLKTLNDISRCLKLVEGRHGIRLKISNIPMDEPDVLEEFRRGHTLSIFQFNTPLATDKVTQMKHIAGVNTLAMITSLARRGPLNMGMDKVFIARANGEEKVEVLHPLIEPVLKETFGVIIYQEQVMSICKALGDFTGDEALTVMKAMGKKKRSVLEGFEKQFLGACAGKGLSPALAKKIWDLMESFAEYGFNKSHAIAYSAMSYICMWLASRYSVEWKTAVLMGADKDDFKGFYASWKADVVKPDVNDSKDTYFINDALKIVMPFSSINGVGEKVVPRIVELQPFASFEDYYRKAFAQSAGLKAQAKLLKKQIESLPMGGARAKAEADLAILDERKSGAARAVSKATLESLILSGCFDRFKPAGKHDAVYRKGLIRKMIELKHELQKPPKAEIREDLDLVAQFEKMPTRDFLYEELKYLNFTGFDYFEFLGAELYEKAKKRFGQPLLNPGEALARRDGDMVVVAGAIESIKFFPTKSGKNKGKEMAKIVLAHNSTSIEVTVFPATLQKDDEGGKLIRSLKELHPLIVKGRLNSWNNALSVVYDSGALVKGDD
jgi:DNA polymerase III alpha subunit